MRCKKCSIIPVDDIGSPAEYFEALENFSIMCENGILEPVFESVPVSRMLGVGIESAKKYFHQFRCRDCGTIYGMFVNTACGGQIKINEKVFDPADYPDKPTGSAKEDK